MFDEYGRKIDYLRISLTERCQQKCTYCSRENGGSCVKENELSAEEIISIARVAGELGFVKIRLTGGEPLLRRDLLKIISSIKSLGFYRDISLTTNAQLLSDMAEELKESGLDRINISLDSTDAKIYNKITGGGDLQAALDGIKSAVKAGLLPVKINAVLIKGINDGEIDKLISLAIHNPVDVRFIELMPMGENGSQGVSNESIIAERDYLTPVESDVHSPAKMYTAEGFAGRIGFISPISSSFCGKCSRMRVTADGFLRPCLGDNLEIPIKDVLGSNEGIKQRIQLAIQKKPEKNSFGCFETSRKMNRIGG